MEAQALRKNELPVFVVEFEGTFEFEGRGFGGLMEIDDVGGGPGLSVIEGGHGHRELAVLLFDRRRRIFPKGLPEGGNLPFLDAFPEGVSLFLAQEGKAARGFVIVNKEAAVLPLKQFQGKIGEEVAEKGSEETGRDVEPIDDMETIFQSLPEVFLGEGWGFLRKVAGLDPGKGHKKVHGFLPFSLFVGESPEDRSGKAEKLGLWRPPLFAILLGNEGEEAGRQFEIEGEGHLPL